MDKGPSLAVGPSFGTISRSQFVWKATQTPSRRSSSHTWWLNIWDFILSWTVDELLLLFLRKCCCYAHDSLSQNGWFSADPICRQVFYLFSFIFSISPSSLVSRSHVYGILCWCNCFMIRNFYFLHISANQLVIVPYGNELVVCMWVKTIYYIIIIMPKTGILSTKIG